MFKKYDKDLNIEKLSFLIDKILSVEKSVSAFDWKYRWRKFLTLISNLIIVFLKILCLLMIHLKKNQLI